MSDVYSTQWKKIKGSVVNLPHNQADNLLPESIRLFLKSLILEGGDYPLEKHLLQGKVNGSDLVLICALPKFLIPKMEEIKNQLSARLKKHLEDACMRLNPVICFTSEKTQQAPPPPSEFLLSQVKHTIVVASGKGGVGKSSVALSLALSLQKLGYKVGLLDADLYGPSLPILMNIEERPTMGEENKILPIYKRGIYCMSIGFLLPPEAPLIWRGPMLQGALLQLLRDVEWPELDFLIVDMPPGTGDIHLTIVQKLKLSGAVIVSTPQKIALVDAQKAIQMFLKLNVPILGLIKNMSHMVCLNCEEKLSVFGSSDSEIDKLGQPLLADIPLDPVFRDCCDEGFPFVSKYATHPTALAFEGVASRLAADLL